MFWVYTLPTGNDMSLSAKAVSKITKYIGSRVISYSNLDSISPIEIMCKIACSLPSASGRGNWTFIGYFEAISPLILNKKPQRSFK